MKYIENITKQLKMFNFHKYNSNWEPQPDFDSNFKVDRSYRYNFFIFRYSVRIVEYPLNMKSYPISYIRHRIIRGPHFIYNYADKYMGLNFLSKICIKFIKLFQKQKTDNLTYKQLKDKYNIIVLKKDLRREKFKSIF